MPEETAKAIKDILIEHMETELDAIKVKMTTIDTAEVGASINSPAPESASYYFDQQKLFASGDFPAITIVPTGIEFQDGGKMKLKFQIEAYLIDDYNYVNRQLRRYGKAITNILKRHRNLDNSVKNSAVGGITFYPGKLEADGGSLLRAVLVTAEFLKADVDGASAETI